MVKKHQVSKKSSAKSSAKNTTKRVSAKKKGTIEYGRVFVGVGATILALLAAIVLAYITLSLVHRADVTERKDRIQAIYKEININEDQFTLERSDIFGEKRPYDWDSSRTWSSVVEYSHGDTVTNTVAKLDEAIKAAGFAFIDEPYPGSPSSIQYHYKSDKGEYVRLTVTSKPYMQAFQNANAMGELDDKTLKNIRTSIDPNSGPVIVTVKVNLDDNNE